MAATQEPKPFARSPLSGCTILILAFGVVAFLLVFSTWALFRQFEEIVKFTKDKQTKVAALVVDEHREELIDLTKRVGDFERALLDDQSATLELSAADINLAIAAWEAGKELRGTFHVDSLDDGMMTISISFPMNGKPRLAKDGEAGLMVSNPRFLEGKMVAAPAVSGKEIVLRIREIVVPGAKVPKEFVEQMSPYRITERYVEDPKVGPALARVTQVEIADGKLRLMRVAGEQREGTIDNETVDQSRNRLFLWLGVAACLFLVVAGLIVFAGLRKSSQEKLEN